MGKGGGRGNFGIYGIHVIDLFLEKFCCSGLTCICHYIQHIRKPTEQISMPERTLKENNQAKKDFIKLRSKE